MNPKHLPLLLALATNLPAAAISTEPFPPSAGEGRGGVSLQTTETNSEPAAPPQTILNPNRKYNLGIIIPQDEIQPDTIEAPDAQSARLPEILLDAAQAAENPIDYTPPDKPLPDIHANASGRATEKPAPGGYSRKILGLTADGRPVVQDYWQDSGAAKTAPFTLKKGASLRDFTTAAVDGKIIWYQPDGSIRAIQQYRDGTPASRLNYYHNGHLAIQGELPPDVAEPDDPYRSAGEADKGIRYYYENGQLLALDYGHRVLNCYNGCKSWNILYDENGQPLAAGHGTRNGCLIDSDHWNSLNHTPADQQAARRQTFDAALARKAMLEQLLRDSGDINPAIKPPFAADAGNKPVPDTPASQPPAPAGAERGGNNPQTAEANSEPAPATTTNQPPPPWGRDGVGAANNLRSDSHHNESQPEPASHPDSRYNLRTWSSAGIEPDTMTAPPALPPQPASTYDAAAAAKTDIAYTPYDSAIGTFPGNNDYSYRTILGETADGRLVVQDYYQHNGTPQTAPLTLKKDADPADFSPAAVDGKIVWYRPDGSIRAIQQYRDGAAVSPLNYYHEGRLAIQEPLPGQPDDSYQQLSELADGIRYYHKNGQILAFDRNPFTYAFYDDQGKPLYIQITYLSHSPDSYHWNTLNSTPADQQAARRKTLDAAWARKTMLEQLLRNNGDPNPAPQTDAAQKEPALATTTEQPPAPAGAKRGGISPQPTEPNREPAPATTTDQPPPPVGEERGGVSLHTAESNSEPALAAQTEPAPATPANQPPPPAGAERGGDNPQTAEANSEPALAITAELPPPPWAGTHEKCERIFCGNRRRGGVGAANNPRSDNIQNKSQTEPAAGNADAPPISMESLPAPPALPVQPLPEDILDAKQAAYNPIDYTPLLPPATTAPLYARYDGKPVKGSAPGGYYRKTLGNTADGRRVVQDYYQDSDTPQTAPFTLKKDANPRDFTTGAVDGKIVWYRKDGSIRAIQQYKNGEAVSPLYTYHEDRLAVATPQPGLPFDDLYNSAGEISRGLRYYHENGQILALERHILPCNGYCERWLNLYDEQGQPLFAETFEKHGCIMDRHYWNALNDLPADQQIARKKALDAARDRYHTLQQMRHDDGL